MAAGKTRKKGKGFRVFGLAVVLGICLVLPARGWEASLYFLRTDGQALGLEKRDIASSLDLTERARAVVEAVLAGPQGGLLPALPATIPLRQVFVGPDKVAYVDLQPEASFGTDAGVSRERLGLWAVVNSLCGNLREIKAVQILVGGREPVTLWGHIDLSRPLLPDWRLSETGRRE